MSSVDDAKNVGPARNAKGFMTNEYIAEAVDRRCFGGHDHTVRPKNVSVLIPAARKIEFDSCK